VFATEFLTFFFNLNAHSYIKCGSMGFSITCFWRHYTTFITTHSSVLSIVQLLKIKAMNTTFQRQVPS